jgi:hypothetical protein
MYARFRRCSQTEGRKYVELRPECLKRSKQSFCASSSTESLQNNATARLQPHLSLTPPPQANKIIACA